MGKVKYRIAGDMAVSVEFGEEIKEETGKQVQALYRIVKEASIKGVTDCVPSYCSLLVYYDPAILSFGKIVKLLKRCLKKIMTTPTQRRKIFEIPVCYGAEYGPDLMDVCSHAKLSPEDVIALHSKNAYLIYMLGFLPGFPYLGNMPEELAIPRLLTPRTKIPAGSVGIGGNQTGIYPIDSPGGWRLIGKTPVKLYEPHRKQPVYYEAGDYIRFVPITKEEYEAIQKQEQDGTYSISIREEEETWDLQ